MGLLCRASASQYSDKWETAEVEAYTKYKAGTGADIQAKIGLHIGLKGVNITLKGEEYLGRFNFCFASKSLYGASTLC